MVKNDPEAIVKLLRAIAGSVDAKQHGHDIIFDAAADLIEKLQADLYNALAACDRD